MEKFEPIKMQELVKVIDPGDEGGDGRLTLVFQNGKTLYISIASDGGLVSEFAED
ncbi:MAG: hypothetical protein J4F28_04445 [Nitrosopumilaceae archaeon]|nr:hypothetical protein [Nitrosopumilaceae archaeon]